jgi:O-antigen ligase
VDRQKSRLETAAIAAACASVVATVISIAASQILLGAAILLVTAARTPVRVVSPWPPMLLFLIGTFVSLALSGNIRAGLPQIRKLYVFSLLVIVPTAVISTKYVRVIILWLGAAATASALWSFVQFARKIQEAHAAGRPFYSYYVGRRITGFMGHWMTFGGELSIVLTLLIALLLFGPRPKWVFAWWGAAGIIAAGLVLSFARGMWFAAAVSTIYLLARWKPKLLLLLPIAAGVAFAVAPQTVRERVTSVYQPHGEVDSNYHRMVTWRTGFAMIKDHPWFGLGPEEVGIQFRKYVPQDVAPPLPEGWYGHLHNIYIQYAAERGVFVLAAFLWFIGAVLRDSLLAVRTAAAEHRAILHGSIAAILAVLTGGFFEFNLGDSEVLMLFLSVVAISYVPQFERA